MKMRTIRSLDTIFDIDAVLEVTNNGKDWDNGCDERLSEYCNGLVPDRYQNLIEILSNNYSLGKSDYSDDMEGNILKNYHTVYIENMKMIYQI